MGRFLPLQVLEVRASGLSATSVSFFLSFLLRILIMLLFLRAFVVVSCFIARRLLSGNFLFSCNRDEQRAVRESILCVPESVWAIS
jgi:hypothetical protein